jgi:hypothetical protein
MPIDEFTDICLVCGKVVCGCATCWTRKNIWNSSTERLLTVLSNASEHPLFEEEKLLEAIRYELNERN